MTADPGHRAGPLVLRLALAFVGVALCAIALVAAVAVAFENMDVANLAAKQRSDLTKAMEVAAAAAWNRDNSWSGAELDPVLDLASRIKAGVQIHDDRGHNVVTTTDFTRVSGPVAREDIVTDGRSLGTITVRFDQAGLGGPHRQLRSDLWTAVAAAAGIAALIALLVALAVSRRITRPVSRLIDVARKRGGGDQAVRVGQIKGPAELRELAASFDRMADTQARQEQLRRNLVADVAHELRTPVAVLQAGHEALLDGVVEPSPAQLSSLRDEVVRLTRMVDDLQTLAAAEAAALQLVLRHHDLARIAQAAAESMRSRFDTAEITLDTRLATALVRADDRRIHQVITNLLSNALKFTPSGGRVVLEVSPRDGHAELAVTDSGVGVPPDELPHLSERFWRGSNAAEIAGSGIGLAVVTELAWAHDGRLEISSTPGQGTTAMIVLPLALPRRRGGRRPPGQDVHRLSSAASTRAASAGMGGISGRGGSASSVSQRAWAAGLRNRLS
jgi:two-component system sensor histidine kinase BaeS